MVSGRPTRRMWTLVFTKQAQQDAKTRAASGLRPNAETLLALLRPHPHQQPPPCEKLLGDLAGAWSRRINIQHRLIYQVLPDIRTVKTIRLWTHDE